MKASYSGSRSRFILIVIFLYAALPQGRVWQQGRVENKAPAVLDETWALQAPCLTFIQRLPKGESRPPKRKDFPMINLLRKCALTYRPLSTASTGLSSVEKRWHGLKGSTQRVESFNPCSKGLIPLSPFCRKVGICCWPYAPSLIHVDQRQRNTCAGVETW
jgi:hypothetical protein